MDYTLSSTGAYDLTSNNLYSDNATIFSSLSVSGINILSSINNLNTSVSSLNGYIGTSPSGLNITGSTKISFYVGSSALTYIDQTGLNIFHTGRTTFPFSYDGYYNIRDRLDQLYFVMQDTPDSIIKYDNDNNTVIKINQSDIYSASTPSKNYPKRIIFKDFLNNVPAYINTTGLNLLDVNGNYNNINALFTTTSNSLLLCSKKNMVDISGDLNVFNMTSVTILGVTYTGGTWLKVADTLNNNISGVTSLNNNYSSLLSQLTTISGNISNIANIANYYSGLQSSLAVVNGVVSGSGLVLAFNLKEDKFDAALPLLKTAPSGTTSFNTLSLKIAGALSIDSNNSLTINTQGFLTPSYGDLGLLPTPSGYTSSSNSYVVLKQISQPMTCSSSLNVMGNLTCQTINSQYSTMPSILFSTSQTIINIPSTTVQSMLISTSGTILNNQITAASSLNVVGSIYAPNIPNQTPFTIYINTPCVIGSTNYYRYDLDLTKYTTFITVGIIAQTRKFKFMCWLSSGAHNSGLYSLNYDIDYSFSSNLNNYNGLNALAYGFPYPNYNLNQITPNGLFIWKNTFNYITIFCKTQINLHCMIIDYLG